MLNPNKMRGHEVVIFWILTFTTIFGGLIYLAYLVYRMDRDSPIVGQQILAREAAIEKERQENRELFLRLIKSPVFWGPIFGFLTGRFLMVNF
jgi:predicted permease